jgi:hypothetical protein
MDFVRNRDWDWMAVLDGDERGGKSTLAMHCLIDSDDTMKNYVETADYAKILERIAFSFDELIEVLEKAPDGTGLIYDEASLLGREAMKEHNLKMIRVFTTIGLRNRFYWMTFPNFWMLDPYLREGRIRTRGYVFTNKGDRGYVTWYVRKRYPWPRKDGSMVWWAQAYEARFWSVASRGPNYAELWAKYHERETTHKKAVLEGSMADARREIAYRLHEEPYGMTIRKIAPIVGRSVPTVGEWLKGKPRGRIVNEPEAVAPAGGE